MGSPSALPGAGGGGGGDQVLGESRLPSGVHVKSQAVVGLSLGFLWCQVNL